MKERFPEGTFSEEDFRRVDTLARFLNESQDWEPGYVPEELSESWVEEAMSVVNAFALDDRARDLYERRLEAERVWKDLIETSEQRGIAKGKAEGKVEGLMEGLEQGKIETATRLKSLGLSVDIIETATGLDRARIERL